LALVEFLCLLTNQYFVFVSVSCFLFIGNLSQFPMTFVLDLRDQILLLNLKVVLILKYIDLFRAKSEAFEALYCLLKMENNQSLYNRFPRNCCQFASSNQLPPCSSVSVAVEEDVLFSSQEKESEAELKDE